MNDTGSTTSTTTGPTPGPTLATFRTGRSETDRTADLLAFGVAVERGLGQTPEAIERARQEADAALGDYSLRYLHNSVEKIRQEAVAAHLGSLRPPPGFLRLVVANLVALAIAGVAGGWLLTRPEFRAGLSTLLGN